MTQPAPTPEPAAATVTRTLRFEVSWPGWRKSDLSDLWRDLWRAQDDLRRAANRAISALYQVRLGTMAAPTKDDGSPVPFRSLCYQALSGKWQPWGEPLYQPTTARPVGSQVILELAGVLYTRLQTDWADIQRGEKALSTMRSIPLGASAQGVRVDRETLEISLPLWAGSKGRVAMRPRKLDPGQRAALRRALKYGNARLQWRQPPGRKGRWMVSISVEQPVARDLSAAPLVAAVRLGMETTCTLAYVGTETGKPARWVDRIDMPESTWRQVRRVAAERTERGRWNRRDRGQREGRGRARKLRAVDGIGDVVARVTDTAIRQVAAAVVAQAVRRGAGVLAVPDLKRWSVAQELDRTEDLPSGDRRAHRRWYFRWHQGALRQRIREAAEREGLRVVDVDVAGASSTCSGCGEVVHDGRARGRWNHEQCDTHCSAEENTARVLASRALAL